ncbi:O-succinylbenzoic acid--CoA ligase [Bacillus sp. SG-1]|nr:O-succinylbenzoic acid--CoA ligase [Bacillus sp. SG-1]
MERDRVTHSRTVSLLLSYQDIQIHTACCTALGKQWASKAAKGKMVYRAREAMGVKSSKRKNDVPRSDSEGHQKQQKEK